MLKLALTFSPLELCDRGEYEAAAEAAGLEVGEWPESVSRVTSEHAERLLVAGLIASVLGGIQQTANQQTARDMLLESIGLFGDDPRVWVARSWLARAFYWAGELDSALELAGEVLTARLDSTTRFRTLLTRASVYSDRRLPDLALAELAEMETFYETLDPLFKGQFHNQRGRVLRLKGETDRAITEYDSAVHFFEEAKNARCQGVAANNLAGIYLETGEYEKAHDYAGQACELFLVLGDKTYQAKAWDQTALTYLAEGKLDKAELAINEGLTLVESGEILSELRETHEKIKHAALVESQHVRDIYPHSPKRPNLSHLAERNTAMTPLDSALLLIQNDPELASTLLDLIIWIAAGKGDPRHDAERDHVERAVFSFTSESEDSRDHDRKRRVLKLVPTSDS